MCKDTLIENINNYAKEYPKYRRGQAAFNYIDEMYGIARYIQFKRGVDCFYNDDKIDSFLDEAIEIINNNGLESNSGNNS